MATDSFRTLSARQRALVATSVLLDGRDAESYLSNDAASGAMLSKVALELSELPVELRMPLVGVLLRAAIEELYRDK